MPNVPRGARYRCRVAPQRGRWPVQHAPRLLVLSAVCVAMLATSLTVASATTASPPTVASLRVRVDRLENLLADQERRSAALAQNYDGIAARLDTLDASLGRMRHRVDLVRAKVVRTGNELQGDAVNAYVYGVGSSAGASLFTQNANEVGAAKVYQQSAIGNLADAEAAYRDEGSILAADQRNLNAQRSDVAQATRAAEAARIANWRIAVRTAAIEHSMGAALRHAVLEAAIRAARAAAAARAAEAAASATDVAGALGGGTGTISALRGFSGSIAGSATGNAAGMAAFAAAKQEIGVPYVWGGETPRSPGVTGGFDCSGLTQWAWAQAGVSIPRTAAAQWYALPHVSLDALQPGDLLFYFNLDGDNQVDHVVMYGGSGPFGDQTTIAADMTGTLIQLQPAFTYGLIGAARP